MSAQDAELRELRQIIKSLTSALAASRVPDQGWPPELGYDPIVKGANTERAVIVDYILRCREDRSYAQQAFLDDLADRIRQGLHYPPLPAPPSEPKS